MKSDPRKRRGDGRNRWKGPRLGAARPGRSDGGSGHAGGSGGGARSGRASGSKRSNASDGDAASFEEGRASSDGGRRPASKGGSSKRADAARAGHAGRARSGSAHSGGSGSRSHTPPRSLSGARGADRADRGRGNDVARKARPEGARGARSAAKRQAGKGKAPQLKDREAASRGGSQSKRPAASPHGAGQRHGSRGARPAGEPRGSGKRQGVRPGKAGAQGRAGARGAPARRQQPRSRPSAAARARSRAAAERERRARVNRRLGFGALVAVLVVVVVVGMRFVLARISEQDETATKVPTNDYKPVKCTSELVQTTLTTKGGSAGRPVAFQATLRNASKSHPCYIDVGWSNLDVNITSGSAQVASIAACHGGAESKRLLLDRGYTATVSLTWNGGTSASGCGNTAKGAKPGTYKAELKLNDNAAAKAQASFALEQTAPSAS